jgi:hypothetical protein
MIIDDFVAEYGSLSACARAMTKAGYHCTQPRLSMVVNGHRTPSDELALQIEAFTKGKYKAVAIKDEALDIWAKRYGLERHK